MSFLWVDILRKFTLNVFKTFLFFYEWKHFSLQIRILPEEIILHTSEHHRFRNDNEVLEMARMLSTWSYVSLVKLLLSYNEKKKQPDGTLNQPERYL